MLSKVPSFSENKYIANPIITTDSPSFTITPETNHKEKFLYFHNNIMASYDSVVFSKWFNTYKYTFASRYMMEDFMKKLLKNLNEDYYVKCNGCNKTFDILSECISHKESCIQLWNMTKEENDLLEFLKGTANECNATIHFYDKKKEIIFMFNKNKQDARPSKYVKFISEMTSLKHGYYSTNYNIFLDIPFTETGLPQLEKIIGKTSYKIVSAT
jgi:hypothetical protein